MLNVFVDASAFIAVWKPDDSSHEKALEIVEKLTTLKATPYTSPFVIAESLNVISRHVSRRVAVLLLGEIRSGRYFVMDPDEDIFGRAENIYKKATSKDLSYMDCIGFEIMRSLDITWTFSFDTHFKKQGFKRLGVDGWPK